MAADAPRPVARHERAQRLCGIYAILNEAPGLLELARAVLDAGVKLVQYRAKGGIVPKNLGILRAMTSESDALLMLNDDWRVAVEFECDGVHLGPGDDGFNAIAPVRDALGDRLIGLSCGTLAEVTAAKTVDVDYLGIGAVYATSSKADAGAAIGIERLRRLVGASVVPVAAIGGIKVDALPQIRASGATMAAVISAISSAANPQEAARQLVNAWRH